MSVYNSLFCDYGLVVCTEANPLAKVPGISSHTDTQTSLKLLDYLPVQTHKTYNNLHILHALNGSCWLSHSYTIVCPPVRGDNPRAWASELSYVQVVKNLYNYFIPLTSV